MSKEEALEILEKKIMPCLETAGESVTVRMAIEALRNQSEIPNSSDVPDIYIGDMISRASAIDALWEIRKEEIADGRRFKNHCSLSTAVDVIRDLPSTQPDRKKGEWTYGEHDGQDGWFCSECGFFIPWYYDFYGLDNINFIRDYHTCPCCDAKMVKYTGMRGEEADYEYERAVEQLEHDTLYESTFNPDDGSM